jgi:hypothetical protein
MVLPAFAELLKIPVNLPTPKEKLKFSFNREPSPEPDDVETLTRYHDHRLNHFEPAFQRPREVSQGGDFMNVHEIDEFFNAQIFFF